MKPLSERWCRVITNKWGQKIYLDQMTMKDLEKRIKENDIVFLPIGSTEAHGPFAPLGEDTLIGVSIAERICYETGCTLAPPIVYGSHPSHHYGLPGTIPVKAATLIEYVSDAIKWLSNAGFKKIILWNSHGQEYVLPVAKDLAIIEKKVHALILVTSWWAWVQDILRKAGTGEEIAPGIKIETPFVHADEVETSVTWYVAPDLIDVEVLKKEGEWKIRRPLPKEYVNTAGNVFIDKPFGWYDISALPEFHYYPKGFVGMPKYADPRKGEIIVNKVIERAVAFINKLKSLYPPGVIPRTWLEEEEMYFNKPKECSEPKGDENHQINF